MSAMHDAFVAARFDELAVRFRDTLDEHDVRLRAIAYALEPLEGRRVLEIGCGKGRFARRLGLLGAEVTGVDVSRAMLRAARGLSVARATAARLPFLDTSFDAAFAVEVLQHVPRLALGAVLQEVARVLRPGGVFAAIDRNAFALDPRRPWLPGLVVKWIDERRGLWMYRSGEPVQERWFAPALLANCMGRDFESVSMRYLLRPEEARHRIFRRVPWLRSMVCWSGYRREVEG